MSIEPFRRLTARVAPLPRRDVDTDQIIPASYLKITDKAGLADGLFAAWRQDEDFVLNDRRYDGAKILLAGENFGCGSSREHAAWALLGHGFRAVLSTRLADIFHNNALKNGLLAVEIDEALWSRLLEQAQNDPTAEVTLDLERQTVELAGGESGTFSIDPFSRSCLLAGVDTLGYLLERLPQIEHWEADRPPRVDTRAETAS